VIRHDGSQLMHDRPDQSEADESGQVLRFRLRRNAGRFPPRGAQARAGVRQTEPLDDLARYEQEDEEDDYRHRMLMNGIAIVVVTLLVGVGVWLADTIADMQKDQDCVMQGRGNCAPIEMPAPVRQ
jgi:hypothetical protein